MKTGIYTEGREWKPHEEAIFLGIDAEKFHNTATRYGKATVDAVARAYYSTKTFVGKRWYLMAVPVALSVGLALYNGLMAVMPANTEQTQQALEERRSDYINRRLQRAQKNVEKGKQFLNFFMGGSSGATLDDKTDNKEAKK